MYLLLSSCLESKGPDCTVARSHRTLGWEWNFLTFILRPCNNPLSLIDLWNLILQIWAGVVYYLKVNTVFTPPKWRWSFPDLNPSGTAHFLVYAPSLFPGLLSLGKKTIFYKTKSFSSPTGWRWSSRTFNQLSHPQLDGGTKTEVIRSSWLNNRGTLDWYTSSKNFIGFYGMKTL